MFYFVQFRVCILLVGLLLTTVAFGNNGEINETLSYDMDYNTKLYSNSYFQYGSHSTFSSLPTYDLTVGTPDENGVLYAAIFASRKVTLRDPISYMGKLVSSSKSFWDGPTFYTAAPEVKKIWRDGWTGKGVNILLVDSYIDEGTSYHGVTTMMITDLIAPGASKYGLDFNFDSWNVVRDIDGYKIDSYKSMGVVNASFGFNYWSFWLNPEVEEDVELAFYNVYKEQKQNLTWDNVFNGTTLIKNLDLSDAVIVKAAGNDSTSSANEPFDYIYATDANINPRLLIVGATVSDGSVDQPTSLASYSNFAGFDMEIANRFLVANGTSPYDTGDLSIDGYKMNKGYGTSYAAPRVAGYVAILRQKFPNLNAEQSASILLETARYDTLSCYPVCPVYIYGKGEASISRALSPVGQLH